MIKIAALTGGRNFPSARLRVRQLIPALKDLGIEMREFIPVIPSQPPRAAWLRPLWGTGAISVRVPSIFATHRYDLTFLQRELISTLFTLEPFIKHPIVFDVDDAIFLRRGGKSAIKISRLSDLIICGNEFLAENFSRWNNSVVVVPTAVDIELFTPSPQKGMATEIIGWIGTSSNFKYLYRIEEALANLFKERPDVRLRIVADLKPRFKLIKEKYVEFISWSEENEVKHVQEMTIGIMPLDDSLWERGKCSHKMLIYMACGIPVVVSPVGMNSDILSRGEVGLAAENAKDWFDSLLGLLSDPLKRERMSLMGRQIVENHFSVTRIARLLAKYLKGLIR